MRKLLISVAIALSVVITNVRTISAQDLQVPTASEAAAVSYQAPVNVPQSGSTQHTIQLILDRFSLLFTTQPLRKAEKYLTLADRELTAAHKAIVNNGDVAVAAHTAYRGEHYVTLFVDTIKRDAYETGIFAQSLVKRAHDAYPYHQKLLGDMRNKTKGAEQNSVNQIIEFSQRNETELKNLELEFTTPKDSSR